MDRCAHCGSSDLATTPTPSLKHHAKLECRSCGRFLRWLPKPRDPDGGVPAAVLALVRVPGNVYAALSPAHPGHRAHLAAAARVALDISATGLARLPAASDPLRSVPAPGDEGDDDGAPDPFGVPAARLRAAVGSLPPSQAEVIRLRWLDAGDGPRPTCADVARRLGVTRSAVSLRERTAMARLRVLLAPSPSREEKTAC